MKIIPKPPGKFTDKHSKSINLYWWLTNKYGNLFPSHVTSHFEKLIEKGKSK